MSVLPDKKPDGVSDRALRILKANVESGNQPSIYDDKNKKSSSSSSSSNKPKKIIKPVAVEPLIKVPLPMDHRHNLPLIKIITCQDYHLKRRLLQVRL